MTTRWLICVVALSSLTLALFGSTRTLGAPLYTNASWSEFECKVSVFPESTECTPVVLSDDTLLSQQELVNCSFIGGPNYQVMGPGGDLTLHTELFEGRDGFSVGVDGRLSVCNHDFTSTTRTVGPDGGRLVFPSGAILDVPAGAVDMETALTLEAVGCSSVDPIFGGRQHVTHDKRCMAAVDIEPADLALLAPITLSLPVGFRNAGESPVLVEVFPDENDYAYRSTDLIHDPEMGRIEVELGDLGVLALVGTSDPSPPGAAGAVHFQNLVPCEEKRIHVQSEFIDLSVKSGDVECLVVFDSVAVTFLDCVGSPTQSHDIGEVVGCPENATFNGRICGPGVGGEACFTDPQPVTEVQNGQTVSLTLWMEAVDPDQGNARLFIADINHAAYEWQSFDVSMGTFPDPEAGSLQAGECTQADCEFDVQVLNRYVSSPLPKGTVSVILNLYGIYDVEWSYSYSAETECTHSNPGEWVMDEAVTLSGSWTGTAAFEVPNDWSSDVLTYAAAGSIKHSYHFDRQEYCPYPQWDPAFWTNFTRGTDTTHLPEDSCVELDPYVELTNSGTAMVFSPCSDVYYHTSRYGSGSDCYGPIEIPPGGEGRSSPTAFDGFVVLSSEGGGVFSLQDTLIVPKTSPCGSQYGTYDIVTSRYVRAVRR